MSSHRTALTPEALDENRSGHLTGEQARRFQLMASGRRNRTRALALPVGAMAMLLLVLSGPSATAVERRVAGWGFVAAAAMLLAGPAFDPLAADVRLGQVEMVEGPVGKRRQQFTAPAGSTRYYLNIAGRRLRTYRSAYEAAPDFGYVRAYYLPRTRRLVNLERLPNPPPPASPDEARDIFARMASARVSGDPVAFAEARSNAAALMDDVQNSIIEPSDSLSGSAAGRLVHSALVGTWTHPLVTITLADDGIAIVTTLAGARHAGHWSVDANGRLLTDATGTMEPMDAALDGDRLMIQMDGRRLTFTRAASA